MNQIIMNAFVRGNDDDENQSDENDNVNVR